MRGKAVLATLCSLLMAWAPFAEAATSAAMGKMNAKGATEVNGTLVTSESNVFAGDRIVTRKDATAALSLMGGSRLLLGDSSIFEIRSAEKQFNAVLASGSLAVLSRGDKPVVTEAAGARIRAAHDDGLYEVAVNGNSLRVIAHKGAATIETADRTVEVAEGKTLDATQSSGPSTPSGLSTFEKVVIFASTTSGFVGLGLGVAAYMRPNPKDCNVVSPDTISCP